MIGFGSLNQSQALFSAAARVRERLVSCCDHIDYVTLCDGTTTALPRANLTAAQVLLAAQKAARRHVVLALAAAEREGGALARFDASGELWAVDRW